jgi:hypothetical protein
MREVFLAIGLLAPDMTARVAVEAAVTINTQQIEVAPSKCCGQCKGGIITHGDGHRTPCPCPPDCKCKQKSQPLCTSGTCALRK